MSSVISTTTDPTPTRVTEHDDPLYVTRRCFGLGTCRNIAPELFGEVPTESDTAPGGASVLPGSFETGSHTGVLSQPQDADDFADARDAAKLCPMSAIRLRPRRPSSSTGERGSTPRSWPRRLEEEVWAVGHPSSKNIGATVYFVERPGGGILVDLPEPSEALFEWLDAHGGVRWIFITHRDHASHHRAFSERFPGCERVIGTEDVVTRQRSDFHAATADVEVMVNVGAGLTALDGTPIPEEELPQAECVVIPQPGHTPGSLCLLYRNRYLFTGDHLVYSRLHGAIEASRLVCWDDWKLQTESVRMLAEWAKAGRIRFDWLLPGHLEWHHFTPDGDSAGAVALERTVEWMAHQPPGRTSLFSWVPFIFLRTRPQSSLARALRLIGGREDDTWVLPRAVRRYIRDHDPAAARAATRRVYAIAAAALGGFTALIGLVLLA